MSEPIGRTRAHQTPFLSERLREPAELSSTEPEPEPEPGPLTEVLRAQWCSTAAVAAAAPVQTVPALRPAFEALVLGGLGREEAAAITVAGLTPDQTRPLLVRLLEAPTTLESYGPRSVAIAIVSEALADAKTGSEIRASLARYERTMILRPDGVLARSTTGAAVERVAPESGLEVGQLYGVEQGVLYQLGPGVEADRSRPPVYELGLDRLLLGWALDGVEAAGRATILGLGRAVEDPPAAVVELVKSLAHLGVAITWAPEIWARFSALPTGDQVEAIAEVCATLALAKGLGGGGRNLISSGLDGGIRMSGGAMVLAVDLRAAALGTIGVASIPLATLGPVEMLTEMTEPGGAPGEVDAVGKTRLADRIDGILKRVGLSEKLRARLAEAREALGSDGDLDAVLRAVDQAKIELIRETYATAEEETAIQLLLVADELVEFRRAARFTRAR